MSIRRSILAALVCLSCGKKTALPHTGVDASVEVAAASGSDASAAKPDAAPIDLEPASDRASAADVLVAADGRTGCVPLSVTALPEPDRTMCPPSQASPVCRGGDTGVVVARSADCVRTWGNVSFQCTLGPQPKAGEEVVLINTLNCMDSVSIESALACADRIELSYVINGSCQECDGRHATWRAFSLPRDDRPVVATGRIIIPPCPPPIEGTVDGGSAPGRIDSTQAAP